ncbi:MAG: hypothetical protein ACT4OW_01525 [Nitrososphaerota archaeon]
MAYFYQFELILVGIILLSVMGYVGVRLWLKRRHEELTQQENENQTQNSS